MEKEFCRKTILLNVDLLVSTLNDDIIEYIKCFIGKKFIINTRNISIQTKYLLSSRETLEFMLYKWKIKHLLNFEKQCIYLKYNLDSLIDLNIYEYEDDDFLMYYNDIEICDLFININIYNLHQNKMTIINRILSAVRVRNYFHFQKTIWIITNKILLI